MLKQTNGSMEQSFLRKLEKQQLHPTFYFFKNISSHIATFITDYF